MTRGTERSNDIFTVFGATPTHVASCQAADRVLQKALKHMRDVDPAYLCVFTADQKTGPFRVIAYTTDAVSFPRLHEQGLMALAMDVPEFYALVDGNHDTIQAKHPMLQGMDIMSHAFSPQGEGQHGVVVSFRRRPFEPRAERQVVLSALSAVLFNRLNKIPADQLKNVKEKKPQTPAMPGDIPAEKNIEEFLRKSVTDICKAISVSGLNVAAFLAGSDNTFNLAVCTRGDLQDAERYLDLLAKEGARFYAPDCESAEFWRTNPFFQNKQAMFYAHTSLKTGDHLGFIIASCPYLGLNPQQTRKTFDALAATMFEQIERICEQHHNNEALKADDAHPAPEGP